MRKDWRKTTLLIGSIISSLMGAIASAQEIPLTDTPQPSWETILDTAPHKLLIIGRWRGFHAVEDQKLYYLYDFKADGTYVARHRLYESENQYKDEFWQGKWDFNGQLVSIEGNESNDSDKKIKMVFKLAEDNFLYAQIEEGSQEILPMKMGKPSFSEQ